HPHLQHISSIQRIIAHDFLWMDRFTIRNLELIHPANEQGKSLLQAIDHTQTPMGARLLKRWLVFPLFDIHKIQQRLALVEYFIKEQDLQRELTELNKKVGDVERLIGKIPLKKINPRELVQLSRSLHAMAAIGKVCESSGKEELKKLSQQITPLKELEE